MQTTDAGNRESSKVQTMPLRSNRLVIMTSGLLAVVGLSGCQSSGVGFRSLRVAPPWQRTQPRPDVLDEVPESESDSETYVPQFKDSQPRLSSPPAPENLAPIESPERPLPVPPALELELPPIPQTRRWAPSRPGTSSGAYSGLSQTSETEENGLPPARVTYNTSETTSDEPIITPAPDHSSSSQPRLFRPAGSAKNMFEAMKRKLSRPDAPR